MTRIGILTGGGDCPGLNAVIRAVGRRSLSTPRNTRCSRASGSRPTSSTSSRPRPRRRRNAATRRATKRSDPGRYRAARANMPPRASPHGKRPRGIRRHGPTRRGVPQNPVGETPCGFDSHLRHLTWGNPGFPHEPPPSCLRRFLRCRASRRAEPASGGKWLRAKEGRAPFTRPAVVASGQECESGSSRAAGIVPG